MRKEGDLADRASTGGVRQVFAFEGRGGFPVWAAPGGPAAPQRRVDTRGRVIPERGRCSLAQVLNYWCDAVAAAACRWHYYAQNHWRRAVADILQVAARGGEAGTTDRQSVLRKDLPVRGGEAPETPPCRDAVALLGYSNGGDACYQVANALAARGVEIDLIVTADPVRKPLRGLGLLGFRKPENVNAWHNFYQRCDRRTLAGWLPVVGRSVAGADVDRRLTAEDFCEPMAAAFAHLWIPAHRLVVETITCQLRELPGRAEPAGE